MSRKTGEADSRDQAFATLDHLAPYIRQMTAQVAGIADRTSGIQETLGDGATPILSDWGAFFIAARKAAHTLGMEEHLIEVATPVEPLEYPLG